MYRDQNVFKFPGIHTRTKILILIFFLVFLLFPHYSFNFQIKAQNRIDSLLFEGKNHLRSGNFDTAVKLIEGCLRIAVESENRKVELECYLDLGLLFWNLDRVDDSSDSYSKASEIACELDLPEVLKFSESALELNRLYLGGKDLLNKKPKEAIEYFQKAVDIAEEIKSEAHELKCLRLMSRAYIVSGSPLYLDLNERALEMALNISHKTEAMKLYNNIGTYHSTQNNHAHALANIFEALRIARDIDSKDMIQRYSNNLVTQYLIFGDFQKSFKYLYDALALAREENNDTKTASILNQFGILYEKRARIFKNINDYQKALEYFEESLLLFKKSGNKDYEIMALNNIGNIYKSLEMDTEALIHYRTGLEKLKSGEEKDSLGMLLTNIGDIQLESKNYPEAEQMYLQALQVGEKLDSSSILQRANFGLGKVNEEWGEPDMAISYYLAAIDEIEHVRSRLVLDVDMSAYIYSKLDVYEHLVNLYHTLHIRDPDNQYGADMFLTAEKRKARSFLENLEASKIAVRKEISDEYKKREIEITNRISTFLRQLSLGDNISSLEVSRIEKELLLAEDDYTNLLNQMLLEKDHISEVIAPKPFSLNYIQDRYLDSKTVLIEYCLGMDKSFVFFISKNTFEIFEMPSRSAIKDSIKAYLKVLTDPSQEFYIVQNASRRLYQELFSPLDSIMPEDITNLIIVPDGVLYYLPFETLLSPIAVENGGEDYLISRFAVSYMPSASSLLFLDMRKTVEPYSKELLVFGAPEYSLQASSIEDNLRNPMDLLYEIYRDQGYEFLPLPYSRKEIKKISGYFPDNKTDVFLNKEASESRIKQLSLDDYKVIHFVCHSFLDEAFPMRSALVMSLDENFKEDGFLKVREIYNFDLNSELVVLSACFTGQGKLEGSEGVLGLPRVFFYAGAKSVVSTLWGIHDRATVDFMNYFYRALSEGKDKAQSLRAAKIYMIKSKYFHPYYWAAFILNGDYRSTITSN